ncbi:MAG: UDP-N-acetylmuramoyl-L-alanine--D-glutamate ligase [Bacillota bacterium]|nr:UDP-N-acetylmuramoyl-L-alanine--D-glutamate ligase [Bacillota bacterium]
MTMGQKVIVCGTGKSGIAAARLLLAKGGEVVLYDGNTKLDAEALRKQFSEDDKVTVVLGELTRTDLLGVELAVISPGISLEVPFVQLIDEVGIPIWGELQLAYHCGAGRVAAITGTNGKTTTTSLVGEILKTNFDSVYVVGNIGEPYADHALEMTSETVTACEVSSFMLETTTDFHPVVSAILNITPDHLDRHHTMERYAEVKESITANQTEEDTCVLNYDDEVLRAFGQNIKPQVVWFSSRHTLEKGYYLDGENIVYNDGEKVETLMNVHEMTLLGRHNHENVMAAIAITRALGVPMEKILGAVKVFKAVEHRIEFVTERFGVKYYNDSKGTNPDAAIQAIKAMPGPTLLIGGGYDKHSEFDEWIESFDGKVRYLVLIGQTRDKIAECAKAHGFNDIMYAEDLQEAVQVCASYANPGDYVLLSPACASWGQFKSFEERGEKFKEYVRNL